MIGNQSTMTGKCNNASNDSKSGSKFLFSIITFLKMERKQHTVPAFENAFEINLKMIKSQQ
jgi:hypothetical protein